MLWDTLYRAVNSPLWPFPAFIQGASWQTGKVRELWAQLSTQAPCEKVVVSPPPQETSETLSLQNPKRASDKDVWNWNPHALFLGVENGAAGIENNIVSSKN